MSAPTPSHVAEEDAVYHRFLRNYYLAHFWYDFIFAYAIYTVYFSLRGLSVFQISLLLSWWTITSIVLEIPTGALADSWSRRKMLALAPLIKSLCFLTWFFAGGNFYLFALGFLFWSAGSAFVSGTSESLLYDTLVHFRRKDNYEQTLGLRQFNFYIGLAIATTSGGLIANYRIDWAILLSVLPLLLSAIFAWFLKETPRIHSTGEVRYLQHIRLAFREMRTNQSLRYLIICLLGISVLWNLEEFDQLYYRLAGLPIYAFGLVGFTGSLLCALGARTAHRIKDHACVIYMLPFASAFLLMLVWRFPSIPAIGLLLLAYLTIVPVEVLVESNLQHSIGGISRATVTSVVSLFTGAFGVGLPVVFGLIGTLWNLPAIYFTSALLLFIFSVWVFSIRK